MKALVTGGAGMIGSRLVRSLIDDGFSVVVVDNFLTGRRQNLPNATGDTALTVVSADLQLPLPESIAESAFDHVYHLASPASPVHYGRYPVETLLVNSLGTRSLLDLTARCGARFLLASTSEVYGDPTVHPQDEAYWGNVNPVGPRSCYDEGKRFAEALTVAFGATGLDVRIARIFNTYGPPSDVADGRMIPNFCVQALRGEPLTVYGTGLQTRSFCYVDDLVIGLRALMETSGLAGTIVNLGSPDETTVLAVAELTRELAGSSSPIVFDPLPADDPVRRCPDIAKAKRLLGWQPTTSLRLGLAETLDWFRRELADNSTSDRLTTSDPSDAALSVQAGS